MLNKLRLLTPGPTPLPEEVRLALARDMIHHRKEEFGQIMASVQEKLKLLFGCSGPVLPLACSGTGAMAAALYSLFKPGEKALVVVAGKFGERWREIAKARGLETTVIEKDWGEAADPEEIRRALEADAAIKGVLIQLCETSTTVLQPVREIAGAIAGSDALLVVDGVSAVGVSPCPMDEWGIDCLLTGSQKGLMLPPGLALLSLSPRAWDRAEKIRPGCYYFDLPAERESIKNNQTHFTTPINLVYGLEASLDLVFKKSGPGLKGLYSRQWALTRLVRTGASLIGLKLLAEKNFAWGVTAILLPEGVDGRQLLKIMLDKYGVCMAGGQDRLKGRIARLGHMGWVDWGDCLAGLWALRLALGELGASLPEGDFSAGALKAYEMALLEEPGL